jgi:hypothetical protein
MSVIVSISAWTFIRQRCGWEFWIPPPGRSAYASQSSCAAKRFFECPLTEGAASERHPDQRSAAFVDIGGAAPVQ